MEEEKIIYKTQALARRAEKEKRREELEQAREFGEDSEGMSSSERSGSKKSGMRDQKSAASITDRQEGATEKSKTHSER